MLPVLGWRGAFAAVGLLALFVLVVRRSLPEASRWLAKRGRAAEAERVVSAMEAEVLRRLGGAALPIPDAADAAASLAGTAQGSTGAARATGFSRAYARRTTMAFGLWFFALAGFFGLNAWIAVR